MIVAFIDDHKHEHGVEPICRVLTTHGIPITPSTYYAFRSRPASRRALTDAGLVRLIAEVHQATYGVYGVRKVWHELRRQGHTDVARCTVERLMRINGLRGVSKAKAPRTTIPAGAPTPEDKVNRQFTAQAPDRLWVADITYVRTFAGWVYAAFILDMHPHDRRLATVDQPAHAVGVGCPRHGDLVETTPGSRPVRLDPSLRHGRSRRIQLVVATPRSGGV